ncbi:MAG: exodeoxyribonuclease VII large subunit [Pseudomonadota bacterium]
MVVHRLDVKDDRAVLSGVVWKGVAGRLRVQPEQGLEVVATGRLTTFPGQSKYQIVIDAIEPAGVGALMALLEERKKKLQAEGLFDEARKQPVPSLPGRVGIITSPTGAVIRDMLHGFNERFPTHVVVWPVRVQGEASAGEVAAAVRGFNAMPRDGAMRRPDVLIVARGGGSLEDLWGFNDEIVARAVAESEIPVISAVGHETDWTLIDLVADARAPTPTKAAEWAVPRHSDLIERIGDLDHRLRLSLRRRIEAANARLLTAARGLPRLTELVGLPRQRFDTASARLQRGLLSTVQTHGTRFARTDARLQPEALRQRMRGARDHVHQFEGRSARAMLGTVRTARQTLSGLSRGLQFDLLRVRLIGEGERLTAVRARAGRAMGSVMRAHRQRLDAQDKLLQSLSYHGVLARGFALVRSGDGTPLRSVEAADPGLPVTIEWADGTAAATIDGDGDGWPRRAKGKRAGSGGEAGGKANQGSLF